MTDDGEIVDALVKASYEVMRVIGRVAAAHELSPVQLRVLGILRDNEPRLSELAEYLDVDRSSISGLIDRAERRGLVERIPDADDGRASRVRLTPAGRRLAASGEREVAAGVLPLVQDARPADRAALARVFRASYPGD